MSAFARSALPLILTAAGLAQDITAQDLAAQEIRFESGVTNIHVDALVKRNGQSVRGLMRDDFVVRDEGENRPLVAFAEEPVPLDLVLLMDMTWAGLNPDDRRERDLMKDMFGAASNALKQMRPSDRAAIISTANPHLAQDLTADQKAIAAALNPIRLRGIGDSVRSLGIQWAVRLLQADAKARGEGAPERKRAILMITFNESHVWMPDDPLIQQLWSMDVALHAISVRVDIHDRPIWTVKDPRIDNPEHIAKATGGDVGHLPQDIPDLVARIESSYSLWYRAPAATHGELRHISVELSDEAKKKYPGAEIRAREGYIAP